jgi:hypothetical protein
MATATLLNVGTPGPALAVIKTAQAAGGGLSSEAQTLEYMAGTVYQLDSISIPLGTWLIIGVVNVFNNTQTNYLNLASATGSNSWPVQQTASSITTNMVIAAIVKVTSTTTIYFNGKNTSANTTYATAMFAVQIA